MARPGERCCRPLTLSCRIVEQVKIDDTQVVVLASGDEQGARSHRRGHLFEMFMAKVLAALGYEEPSFENLNISANGIEIDIEVKHALTRRVAIAECKAYSTPVQAKELTNFIGKRYIRGLSTKSAIDGFFFALPRLTSDGVAAARSLENEDAASVTSTRLKLREKLRKEVW